jgi:hypothetical protein
MILRGQNIIPCLLRIFTFILILLGLISCKVARQGNKTNPSGDIGLTKPQIIFINYSIKHNKSGGTPEIHLINKIITEGKLKNSLSVPDLPKPGDLSCITLNTRMEPVDSLIISDPLNVTVESVDENNLLFKKEISLDSAQFSIRMQLNERVYAVGMKTKAASGNQNSYLLITKIK